MISLNINPVAFSIGPIEIYWYALSYIFGLIIGLSYLKLIIKKCSIDIPLVLLESLMTPIIVGIIVGGRLGYVLFYDPIRYFYSPLEIIKTYKGGMSFHGGVIGLILANFYFCYKNKINFFILSDLIVIVAPIGLFLGRIANFINSELVGRITNVSWGVIFIRHDFHIRHPSQLYESFLEGLVLFCLLSYFTFKYNSYRRIGFNSGFFLLFYSTFRILIEFFREPDLHIGYIFNIFTLGQFLSLPMFCLGIYLLGSSTWKLGK